MRGASRSASATSTLRWISGESSIRRRNERSVITSARTGVVAVTVAVRGESETRAISPKKSPAPSLLMLCAALGHVGLALQQHEELAAARALLRHLLALAEVDLVRDVRDLLELVLGAAREERDLLDQLDLLVAVQHVTSLSPSVKTK